MENIDIDEFSIRKVYVYKTIVVYLYSSRIIYVGCWQEYESKSQFREELSGLNSHKSSNIHIQYRAIYEADKAQVNETL